MVKSLNHTVTMHTHRKLKAFTPSCLSFLLKVTIVKSFLLSLFKKWYMHILVGIA